MSGTVSEKRLGAAARGELLSDEESRAVQRELSLKNLNHTRLFVSMIRRNHAFYLAVISFTLFAAWPVARVAPLDASTSATRALLSAGVGLNGSAASGSSPPGWTVGEPRAALADLALHNETQPLPFHMVWMYLHPAIMYDLDERLRAAFAADNNRSSCLAAWPWNEIGWPRDRTDWE